MGMAARTWSPAAGPRSSGTGQIGRRLSVEGLSVGGFDCRNRTTGQEVRIATADSAVDCEDRGLSVSPGDELEILARGQAE